LPAGEPVQESVEVPEPPVRLVDESAHDKPVEFVVTTSVTVPEKPFREATVIAEVAEVPTVVVTLVGLAVIPKSGAALAWYVTEAECTRALPPLPVTVAR
jgi:hypothetical protein